MSSVIYGASSAINLRGALHSLHYVSLSLSLSAAVPSGETVTSSGKVHGLVQWVSMLFRSINPPWLFHDWDQQTIDQTIERGPLKRARMYQDTNKSYVEMLGTSQDKVKWVRRKYCLDA